MLGYSRRLPAIATIVVLSGVLVSCGGNDLRNSAPESTIPATSTPSVFAASPSAEPTGSPAMETAFSPSPSAYAPASGKTGEEEGVGIAGSPEAIDPPATGRADGDKPFDGGRPSLHGIALGDSDASVEERFGEAGLQYALPGDGETLDMWEYDGFSVGYTADGAVNYIEITSPGVSTGIAGLKAGMPGARAADLLDIANHPDMHVLTQDVSGGWLKLDLDPDTHAVLSIKLLGTP